MTPTLNPLSNYQSNDVILISKFRKPSRGDVVVLKAPFDPDVILVKRLIGIEGDIILPNKHTLGNGNRTTGVKIPMGYAWVESDGNIILMAHV